MPTSLRHILIIMSFVFPTQACVAEKKTHQNTQFIVQLTDISIQKFKNSGNPVDAHRNAKLQQWSQRTGLVLKAVPPTSQQRWIIKANTQDASHIKKLVNTVSDDIDIKYIEEDRIMAIHPTQRLTPTFTSTPTPAQP